MGARTGKYARAKTEAEAIEGQKALREINARWPAPRATFDDALQHILHAIAVAGIDHVGLSGDFDGGRGGSGAR